MTLRVQLSTPAQRDIADAKAWYASQQVSGLDLRFQQEVEEALQRIETVPEGFQVVHRDVRQANLRRFPYGVFYHPRDDVLYVLAVVHHARHPRVWQRRR